MGGEHGRFLLKNVKFPALRFVTPGFGSKVLLRALLEAFKQDSGRGRESPPTFCAHNLL